MASVKQSLKAAAECIGKGDYKDALQHCKAALKADKNNYDTYMCVCRARASPAPQIAFTVCTSHMPQQLHPCVIAATKITWSVAPRLQPDRQGGVPPK
jgi:hypothetical protein